MKKSMIALTTLLAAASQLAGAHPGHGVEGHSDAVLHPFLGSEHVLLLGLIGVAAMLLGSRFKSGAKRDDEE